jgi:hypothetical protein
MKPLLLLDVDGVINLFSRRSLAMHLEQEFVAVPPSKGGLTFPIRVPAGTSDRIAQLEERFQLVWATTWETEARSVLAPQLGFGEDWPVIEFPVARTSHPLLAGQRKFSDPWTAKLDEVLTYSEDRPMAWIDDILYPDAHRVFRLRDRTVAPSLLIQPQEHVGLHDGHVKKLLTWADGLDSV